MYNILICDDQPDIVRALKIYLAPEGYRLLEAFDGLQALEIARRTARIAWQNVIFALAVKLLVMVLGLGGYASMWMAVFADSGVAMLCVLNSIRMLYKK